MSALPKMVGWIPPYAKGRYRAAVPNYRRADQAGGTYFLTLVTHERRPIFRDNAARQSLRHAIVLTRRAWPFDLVAAVLLPEHLHLIVTLPTGQSDFSKRVAAIKARFTREWLAAGGSERAQSSSRTRQGYRGVWQKRFWEHHVRDDASLADCCDYIHYNPVRHGHACCPHAWAWSTFHRFAARRVYPADWLCVCSERLPEVMPPRDIPGVEMDGE